MAIHPPPAAPPGPGRSERRSPRPLARLRRTQHRMALLLGVDEERRSETVITMLESNARRAPGYWIQLFLAAGIATLGLVLDSTAVVIGAMLVSPLMGPLVELGMGFAIGSSLLVIRASLRVLLSVAIVVSVAALLTLALPFHEITSEVAARSAPTALDLLVATFCALAAAYTTVRVSADTTAAAAGTAIGIALVPPLCTVGFGVGTATWHVAGGAILLFVANLSAILVFAVASFLLLGFNEVDAPSLEDRFAFRHDRVTTIATRAEAALRDAFGSRYGMAVRVLVPLLFLAAVYVPLRSALDEVSWQVRTRDSIRRILGEEAPRAVQSSLDIGRQSVSVRLLLLGSPDSANAVERRIETRVAAAAGVAPSVSVTAVPDMRTLNALALAQPRANEPPPPPVFIPATREQVRKAFGATWMDGALGPLLGWDLTVASNGAAIVSVRHGGAALGIAAESLMAHTLSRQLSYPVSVRDVPVATDAVVLTGARAADRQTFLSAMAARLGEAARADSSALIVACVTRPPSAARSPSATDRAVLAALDSSTAAAMRRVQVLDGDRWAVRITRRQCAGPQ